MHVAAMCCMKELYMISHVKKPKAMSMSKRANIRH